MQKRNLVINQTADDDKIDSSATAAAADEDHFISQQTSGGQTHLDVVEQDKDNSMKVYCSWRFLLGLMIMVCCLCFHVYLIQFLDLTLISANSANSVVATLILSTAILGETFIWKYDFTALFFISAGCVVLVFNANTAE